VKDPLLVLAAAVCFGLPLLLGWMVDCLRALVQEAERRQR